MVVTGRVARKHLFKKQLPQTVLSCWRLFCRGKRPDAGGIRTASTLLPAKTTSGHTMATLARTPAAWGAYCPAPVVSPAVHEKIVHRIVEPMHAHLRSQSTYGVLFVLTIDENDDPFVVEFNVRFGDPECQVTLPLIDTDLFTLLHSAAVHRLEEVPLNFKKSVMTVVWPPRLPLTGQGKTNSRPEDVLKSTNYRDRWVNIAGVASGEQGTLLRAAECCPALPWEMTSEALRISVHLDGRLL